MNSLIPGNHPDQKKENNKIRNLVAGYNMIVNLFWSVVNLFPISVFCYRHLSLKLFLIFLIISFLSVFLPNAFFDSIQLGKTSSFYKGIGVGFVNQFAQNGEIINRLVKRKYPNYKMVSGNRRSIRKLIGQTYMFEKFHFLMFLFFMFVTVYAAIKHYWWWALVIFVTNVIYNVYPNFLQQYIRVRLKTFNGLAKSVLVGLLCLCLRTTFGQFSTEMKTIYSKNVQDSFEIYISTPPSFNSDSTYNVVYYFDANLKSGRHLQSLLATDSYNATLHNTIFVGIGHIGDYHVLRRRDFIPPTINGKDTLPKDKTYGQVERFYSFLKNELMVEINQEFKTNRDSTAIIGHSLGGLFVFFCLFKSDNLFQKYFALSPALWIDKYVIYKFNRVKEGFEKKTYFFFVAGSKETQNRILNGTNEAKRFLDKKNYSNFTYEYEIINGESHNSEVPISLRKILAEKL